MRPPWVVLFLLWGCEVHTSGLGLESNDAGATIVEDATPAPALDAGTPVEVDAGTEAPIDAGTEAPVVRARVHGTHDGRGYTGLNLRDGPSTSYDVIAVIPEGCLVTLDAGEDDRWRSVRFLDRPGWAHDAYLEIVPDGTEDPCAGYDFFLPWSAGESYHVILGHDSGRHNGADDYAWDFALPTGTIVRAASSGFVRLAATGPGGDCGETWGDPTHVALDRGDGVETLYVHLSTISVRPGDVVRRGQPIGTAGVPGSGCDPHMHFQVQRSPGGGGTSGWWNESLPSSFHDDGVARVPLEGDVPVSGNVPL
jgi:hypothetical protein